MDKNDIRKQIIDRIEAFTKKDSWIGAGADIAAADSLIELFVFLNKEGRLPGVSDLADEPPYYPGLR